MQRKLIGDLNSNKRGRQVSIIELLRSVPPLLKCVTWFGLMMGLVLPHPAAAGEGSASTKDRPSAITVFGGLMTDNDWQDAFAPWALDFRDSIGLKQRF